MANYNAKGRALGHKWDPNRTVTAAHPVYKMTWKRAMLIERIARLTLDPSGYTNEQIGILLNKNKQTVVLVRQLPEFKAKIMELQSGVLSSYDEHLRANVDNARREMISMLPVALNVIKDAAIGRMGKQLQFKAAQEILDREGNLSKVSKTSVSIEKSPDLSADPLVINDLLALLGSAPAIQQASFTVTAVEAEFNTKPPLGPAEPEAEKILDSLDIENATKN